MQSETFVQTLILGIVQGIAEFLPISSSGHLVIFGALLGQTAGEESLELNIAMHLGTLLSIVVVYRRDLAELILRPSSWGPIILATLPVVVVGLSLKDLLTSAFETPLVAGCCLWLTAGLLLAAQRLQGRDVPEQSPSYRQAMAIGLFQALAILPGVSRSGSTIAGGMLVGVGANSSARFSFLIAIPAIGGAASLMLLKIFKGEAAGNPWSVLLLGGGVAFLVGTVALRTLLAVVARGKLHWFAYYCAAVGLATVVWQLLSQ